MKQLNGFSQSHTEIYSWWYRDEKEADNKPLFGTDEQRVSLEEMDEPIDMEKDLTIFELKDAVNKALVTLEPRQERVLRLRFDFGYTLEEVGRQLSVSRERVRQIEAKALRMLRHPKRGSILSEFV